jgi:YfiR/HmsC-like
MRSIRYIIAFAVLGVLAAILLPAGLAQAQVLHDEGRVKAAFLVRFGQFIEWPAESSNATERALAIGVIGSPPVLEGLQELASNRATPGRPLTVHAIKSGNDLPAMHILFVGALQKAHLAQHVANIARRPVLVVAEWEGAVGEGAAINFMLVERRVRFEIALDTAQKAGLVVSSRLLAVAARVHRGGLMPATLLSRERSYLPRGCVPAHTSGRTLCPASG